MSFSISGLSGSGLDTKQLVQGLMDVERLPLQNLQTKKNTLQAQQTVFRQLNSKLNTLQTAMSDLNLSTAFNINKGTVSNTNIASVTAQANAAAGNYNINVISLAQFETRVSENTYSSIGNGFTSSNMKFELNGESITLNPPNSETENGLKFNNNKDVLENLVKEINQNSSKFNATAALIDKNGDGRLQLVVTATEGKAESTVDFKLASGGSIAVPGQNGKPAVVELNGVRIERSSNNFENLISGVTITAKEIGTTQLTVGKDTDTVAANVQKFVNAYNDVIDFINTNIAKPTEKGVINPLQGDSVLKQLKIDLYNMITVGTKLGDVNQPTEPAHFMENIGLSIDANKIQGNQFTGKITFNTEMFKKNHTENGHIVEGLFTNLMKLGVDKIKTGYTDTFSGMISGKVSGFDNLIKMNDERAEQMTRSLAMKEARLNQQFNSMETMLLSLNNQSSWLKNQFDSLTKIKE